MGADKNYEKFENWLLNIIKKEKPKEEIKAYNIGIFQNKVSYSLYLMGSKKYDPDDSDWACKQDYFPADRYFDFPKEYVKDKEPEDIEKEVIGFAQKFSKHEKFKESFLGQAQGLTVGFDDGDLHTIN